MIYLSFFTYFLGTPISRNTSNLVAASETTVSNILIIKKTKKIFSFSQKNLRENLKANAKTKNTKSQEYHENFSEKNYIHNCLSTFHFHFIFLFQPKTVLFGLKSPTFP